MEMASSPPAHAGTQPVVFDAEPIIIWVDDDPGATDVEQYLSDTYYGNISTYMSAVNLTEVHYNCADRGGPGYGTKKTQQLQQYGVGIVNTGPTWEQAARYKHEYTPDFPLGDAYALATAAERGLPLIVGDDTHWDDPENDGHDIIRIS